MDGWAGSEGVLEMLRSRKIETDNLTDGQRKTRQHKGRDECQLLYAKFGGGSHKFWSELAL